MKKGNSRRTSSATFLACCSTDEAWDHILPQPHPPPSASGAARVSEVSSSSFSFPSLACCNGGAAAVAEAEVEEDVDENFGAVTVMSGVECVILFDDAAGVEDLWVISSMKSRTDWASWDEFGLAGAAADED
jgi:hypothetical protein